MKIRMKLVLSTLAIVLIILAISMGAIYKNIKVKAEETSIELAMTTAREYSYKVEEIFDEISYVASDVKVIIKRTIEHHELEKEDVVGIFKRILKSHDNVYSIGVILNSARYKTDLPYVDGKYQSLFLSKDGFEGSAILKSESAIDIESVFTENKNVLTEATEYEIDGKKVKLITLFYPITTENNKTVLIRVDLGVDVLQKITESITIFDSGFARILSNTGVVVTHKNPKRVGDVAGEIRKGKPEKVKKVIDAIKNAKEYSAFSYSASTDSEVFKSLTPIKIIGVDTPWAFGTIITEDDIYSSMNELKPIIILTIIGSIIVIIVAMIILSGIITKPIVRATNHAMVVSELDFTEKMPESDLSKKDEVGTLLNAFVKLEDNIKAIVEHIHNSSDDVTNASDKLKNITNDFSKLTENISNIVKDLAKSAREQASDTEEGATKVSELGNSIELVNQKIYDMKEIVNTVYEIVNEGDAAVQKLIKVNEDNNQAAEIVYKGIYDTNGLVESIARSSEQIAQIADQTNLLALNAAIESARAGEAGKGFSVVAEEIRKLAEESSKLTDEISSIISNLRNQSEQSVKSIEVVHQANKSQKESVNSTRQRFNAIQNQIDSILTSLNVLFEAGENVNNKKEEIKAVLNNLSKLATENANNAEETSNATDQQTESLNQLEKEAVELHELSMNLNKEVNKFKF